MGRKGIDKGEYMAKKEYRAIMVRSHPRVIKVKPDKVKPTEKENGGKRKEQDKESWDEGDWNEGDWGE